MNLKATALFGLLVSISSQTAGAAVDREAAVRGAAQEGGRHRAVPHEQPARRGPEAPGRRRLAVRRARRPRAYAVDVGGAAAFAG